MLEFEDVQALEIVNGDLIMGLGRVESCGLVGEEMVIHFEDGESTELKWHASVKRIMRNCDNSKKRAKVL